VPLGDIGQGLTAYPYLLILGQDDNEKLLGDKLRSLGRDVLWRAELIALEQLPDGVRATIRLPEGAEQVVTARYVGGCDGAKSAGGGLNKITSPGAPSD